jgi:putative ABC transport system permease protein
LGASPSQLAWQLLIENALLLAGASFLGFVLSVYGMDALRRWSAAHLPVVIHLQTNTGALLAALFISLVTGLLFGVAPAIVGSRVDLRASLNQAGRQGASLGRRRSQKVLVIAEVALALVLLSAAGLLTDSLRKLTSTDLGFQTANLLTLRLDLRSARYTDQAARARFGKRLAEKLQSLPGVDSATLWGPSMLGRATWVYIAYPEGASPEDSNARLMMGRHSVNPEALQNLGIPLVRGRRLSWNDTADQPPVAVISESVARRLWPGQDPLGKRMHSTQGNAPWVTVVGVARDAHHSQLMDLTDAAAGARPGGLGPQYDVYFPYLQRPNQGVTVAIRTARDIRSMSQEIKEAVLSLDPTLPVYDLRMLDDRLAAQVAPVRTVAALSAVYALLALFFAAFGLFAMLGHDVSQRTHEIGIRMALGASPRAVLSLILGEGMALTLAGLGAGLIAALSVTQAMRTFLFGVSSTDPAVFAIIAFLLICVAIVACCIPARKAMRLDPMAALRHD